MREYDYWHEGSIKAIIPILGYVCGKCGKEYLSKDYYNVYTLIDHLEHCRTVDEFFNPISGDDG